MILKPVHQCKLLGDVTYQLAGRAKSAASSPSTNRPVTCPVCKMYGWSYNMAAHAETGPCSGAKGSAALTEYAPQHHKREWLLPFLKKNKSSLKRCSIVGCACKPVRPA